MEITLRMNLREDADPAAVGNLIALAHSLDAGLPNVAAHAVGEIGQILAGFGPLLNLMRAAATEAIVKEGPAGATADYDSGLITEGSKIEANRSYPDPDPLPPTDAEASVSDQEPEGIEVPGAPKKGGKGSRGGRKQSANAESVVAGLSDKPPPGVTVEQAVRQEQPTAETTVPPAGFSPPPGAAPPVGIAVPPGATAPVVEPAQPSATAMPPTGEPRIGADGFIDLETFKAQAMELHNAASSMGLTNAFPFNVIRMKGAWPDGSPKDFDTFSFDKVPPAQRQVVLDQCAGVLTKGA